MLRDLGSGLSYAPQSGFTGENDVTVIFKSEASGRRWQHLAGPGTQQQGVERNYTLILGSHRNTCIRIEKDGQLCDRVTITLICYLLPATVRQEQLLH